MDIKNFPLVASALTERDKEKFSHYLRIISDALAAGQIANPVWVDVKFSLGRILERAWDALDAKGYKRKGWVVLNDSTLADIDNSLNIFHPEMHSIVGKAAKLRAVANKHEKFAFQSSIFEELLPLGEAFQVLKTKTVKRQPKAADDRKEKYSAPAVSGTAMAKVREMLVQITEDNKKALEEYWVQRISALLQNFLKAQTKAKQDGNRLSPHAYFRQTLSGSEVESLLENKSARMNGEYTIRADAKNVTKAIAAKIADAIRENFVIKNLCKIDSVIAAKGNFKSGKIVGTDISMGCLEGNLYFDFEDGSSFVAHNAAVFHQNSFGTNYYRYPLTFTRVTMPNGKPMSAPSEKRMNEIFVKGTIK